MWQDIRFGIRTLAQNPGFTVVAITALALGIGANATVFSLANAILFKNLPFADSDRVLYITSFNPKNPRGNDGMSRPDYDDLRAQGRSFSGLGAAWRERVNLSDDANLPDSYTSAHITANSFALLGQQPVIGRLFVADDEKPGANPVAILGFSLWEKRYGRDPSVIGRKIRIDSVPATVIGVTTPGFAMPADSELWTPYIPDPKEKRQNRNLLVFGKLAPKSDRQAAQSELAVVATRLQTQYKDTNKDIRFQVQSFNEASLRGPIRVVFLVLLGAVGFVLLIACANVANLLLSRAVSRAREISIRAALGAGRWRVVRQLLTESLLLSVAGGLLGWAIASWGIRAFDAAVIPTGKPVWINFAMDYRAFGYLAVITLITAILFGLAPALRLSRMDVNAALKEGGRAGSGIRGKYLSGVLVVVEMTLAVVLLAGAGLMIRSFLLAYSRPAGVNTTNILTMRLELPTAKYAKPADQLEFQRHLTERLRALPGVEVASVASNLFGNGNFNFPYELEGQSVDPDHRPSTSFLLAGEGYFETLQLSARRGRVLHSSDHLPGPGVAVINEAMSQKLWPNQDPLGKRFRVYKKDTPGDWMTVVGIVPNVLQNGQRSEADPTAIIPFRQEPKGWMTVIARTRVSAGSLGNAFRREVQAIDPDLPVHNVSTLDDELALTRWPLRVFGSMFAIFAGIALLLATVGLYAVMAYGVNQQTREIGLRVALGAPAASILRMVFSFGMRQAAIGLILGLAAAFGVTRVLSAILVGVSPTDPLTYGLVAAVLVASATLGCLIPARRAIRVDPAVALRHE
ncbi:MAG TPA: ABC transporter permease [Bryobacteraceae bacterium]|nr:ABC transporter permease [Bryobacteraceae bacterium]